MPFADLSEFEKNPELTGISDLFTVDLIARYIQGKLAPARTEAAVSESVISESAMQPGPLCDR